MSACMFIVKAGVCTCVYLVLHIEDANVPERLSSREKDSRESESKKEERCERFKKKRRERMIEKKKERVPACMQALL